MNDVLVITMDIKQDPQIDVIESEISDFDMSLENATSIIPMRFNEDPKIGMDIIDGTAIKMGVHHDGESIHVIDNLESHSKRDALSANQGRVLNEKIENSGFITQEVDPTVPSWSKEPTKPAYTPEEVGAVNADNELALAQIDAMFAAVFGG